MWYVTLGPPDLVQVPFSGSVGTPQPTTSLEKELPRNPLVSKKGTSGYSVGLGIQCQSTEVEVDGGFEVLSVAIATSGNADRLDS